MMFAVFETMYRGLVDVPTELVIDKTDSEIEAIVINFMEATDAWPCTDMEVVSVDVQPRLDE